MANFKEEIAKVKAFVFDVDGVMTDGGIMPIGDGSDFIRKYNAKCGIISLRRFPVAASSLGLAL